MADYKKHAVFIYMTFIIVFINSLTLICSDSKKPKEDKVSTHSHHNKTSDESHETNTPNKPSEDDWTTSENSIPILFPEIHFSSAKREFENNSTATNDSALSYQSSDANKFPSDADEEDEDDNNNPMVEKSKPDTNATEETIKCTKALDLMFMLDSSESVKFDNWKLVIKFVKDLANQFSSNLTRVGIIRYDSEAELVLPMTQFNDSQSRDTAIDNIFYKTGGTRTDIALGKALDVLHNVKQRKSSQVLILITDGPTNQLEINKNNFVDGKDLVQGPADQLREDGVAIFTIGIEPDSETPNEIARMREELKLIASEPPKSHIFIADGYRQLQKEIANISRAACVVNGGWSYWSEFSPCSVTCGYGTKLRMRSCTSPTPENNGAICMGPRVMTVTCDMGPCTSGTNIKPQPQNVLEESRLNLTSGQPNQKRDIIPEYSINIKNKISNAEKLSNHKYSKHSTARKRILGRIRNIAKHLVKKMKNRQTSSQRRS